jgi:hypothetical protein|tara:strand:+ start:1711 stop:2070 length:360 start_codon:yes stop_codon:yes gene_type:complete
MEIAPLDILNNGESAFQKDHGYHYHSPYRGTTAPIGGQTVRIITNACKAELDTDEIQHGLSDEELRVLLKIIAKRYDDCGRKRGAILRYIKHYMEQDVPLGNKRMFAVLRTIDIASRTR